MELAHYISLSIKYDDWHGENMAVSGQNYNVMLFSEHHHVSCHPRAPVTQGP